jgi:hypothetical protein
LKSRFTVYQFLVRLAGFKPAIWRRLRLAEGRLELLHEAIQPAFGLAPVLPFEFLRREPSAPSRTCRLAADVPLAALVPRDMLEFELVYVAGQAEPWRCRIAFEGWILSSFGVLYPYCVEGERAGIPDRRMGPREFREFLRTWAPPESSASDFTSTWLQHDPAVIDLAAINADLQRSRSYTRSDGPPESLLRLPLDDHEWQTFWDWATVDEDERDRMMSSAGPGAVWLYLPEAIDTQKNLLKAAAAAESEATRDLLDMLAGRLLRHVNLHRQRQNGTPSQREQCKTHDAT